MGEQIGISSAQAWHRLMQNVCTAVRRAAWKAYCTRTLCTLYCTHGNLCTHHLGPILGQLPIYDSEETTTLVQSSKGQVLCECLPCLYMSYSFILAWASKLETRTKTWLCWGVGVGLAPNGYNVERLCYIMLWLCSCHLGIHIHTNKIRW